MTQIDENARFEPWRVRDAKRSVCFRRNYKNHWLIGAALMLEAMFAKARACERIKIRGQIETLVKSKEKRRVVLDMFDDIGRSEGDYSAFLSVLKRRYQANWRRAAGRVLELLYGNCLIEERAEMRVEAESVVRNKRPRRAVLDMFDDLDMIYAPARPVFPEPEQQEPAPDIAMVPEAKVKKEQPVRRADLVRRIAEEAGLTRSVAQRALNGLISSVSSVLSIGEKVSLVGFGTFSVSSRAERQGRNPRTGERLTIAAVKIVKFKAGKALGEKIGIRR